MASAFFYGILMHPKILKRVLHNDASHLQICPAILTEYTRHKVKLANYPAIIPCERSKIVFGRELTPEENNIRGTLVTGLTARDVMLLDVFEGTEYIRQEVYVNPLGRLAPVPSDAAVPSSEESSIIQAALPPPPPASELAQTMPAQTYVWCLDDNCLEKELWSFEEFASKPAHELIDPGARSSGLSKVDAVMERLRGKTVPHEKTRL